MHYRGLSGTVEALGEILVDSLVVFKIEYCNCLLAGLPAYLTDKLQSVMNAAARIVCGGG